MGKEVMRKDEQEEEVNICPRNMLYSVQNSCPSVTSIQTPYT